LRIVVTSVLVTIYNRFLSQHVVALGGIAVSVIVTGPNVRGFKPGKRKWIFNADINLQHTSLQRGSKAGGPMSSDFTACQRTLQNTK
jgi:hypothetical protein